MTYAISFAIPALSMDFGDTQTSGYIAAAFREMILFPADFSLVCKAAVCSGI